MLVFSSFLLFDNLIFTWLLDDLFCLVGSVNVPVVIGCFCFPPPSFVSLLTTCLAAWYALLLVGSFDHCAFAGRFCFLLAMWVTCWFSVVSWSCGCFVTTLAGSFVRRLVARLKCS